MRGFGGYICLTVLLGMFALLTAQYSFWVAFGIMYFAGMSLVTGTAFAARHMAARKLRATVIEDSPEPQGSKELVMAKNLRAA